jgi:small GTP-binding protein
MMMAKRETPTKKAIKFLLIGLDNAGKTSIYLSLSREVNLLSYCKVNPTREMVVRNLETGNESYAIWDLGGQEQTRKQYISQLPEMLQQTDKIIYVIDIQDAERYTESLEYLKSVADIMKKHKKIVPMSIFLHKYDKGLEKMEKFSPDYIKTELIEKIDAILSDFYHEIFKTAILPMFQKERVV